MKSKLKVAQIGCGYWGPNILRSIKMLNSCELKTVVETDKERQNFVKSRYANIIVTEKLDEVLKDEEIEAIIIATPASSHYQLAKMALEANKHVLVEKPLATNLKDAKELSDLSYEKERVLMVGHVFLYNPAVIMLKKILQEEADNLYYIHSQRLNLGRIRHDVNAWWNLAPHDLSILSYLMKDEEPISIAVNGYSFLQPHLEDVVFATLKWKNNVMTKIHLSWLDPRKVRQMTIVSSKKMIIYNDLSEDKIAIHNKGIDCNIDFDDPGKALFNHRIGDISLPKIDMKEPLLLELEHFIECIVENKMPKTGPLHACKVINMLEAGQKSLNNKGVSIEIKNINKLGREYAKSTI